MTINSKESFRVTMMSRKRLLPDNKNREHYQNNKPKSK
jgi:hypothetical protein